MQRTIGIQHGSLTFPFDLRPCDAFVICILFDGSEPLPEASSASPAEAVWLISRISSTLVWLRLRCCPDLTLDALDPPESTSDLPDFPDFAGDLCVCAGATIACFVPLRASARETFSNTKQGYGKKFSLVQQNDVNRKVHGCPSHAHFRAGPQALYLEGKLAEQVTISSLITISCLSVLHNKCSSKNVEE